MSAAHGSTNLAFSHSSPPIAVAAAAIRGSRRRAAASTTSPNVAVPCRIKASALLHAPSAMLAAIPSAPNNRPNSSAETIATAKSGQRREQRRAGVLAREEGRRQCLDQHVSGQRERQPHQRLRGGRGVDGGERAVLEQRAHDRFAQHDQAQRRRQREPNRELEPARTCLDHRGGIVAAQRAGQFGHQHGAHGGADDPERQFDQAIGEIQPRHRRGRRRGDDGAGDDQPLRPGTGDHARDRPGEKAAHFRVDRGAQRRREGPAAAQHEGQQLQQPGDADRGRDRERGIGGIRSPEQQHCRHGNQREVEQKRREGRQRETPLRIQQRHHDRDRACECEIRQHQARILDGEPQRRMPGESWRQYRNDQRHQQADQRRHDDQRRTDGAEHAPGEGRCRGCATGFAHAHPGRHQRRIQRALGQQPADHIDQLKRHQERVGDGAGAEQRRDHRIAHESQQPRNQRARGYGQEGTDHEGFYTIALSSEVGAGSREESASKQKLKPGSGSEPNRLQASLAGTRSIVIGRSTLLHRFGADFPHHRKCRNGMDG